MCVCLCLDGTRGHLLLGWTRYDDNIRFVKTELLPLLNAERSRSAEKYGADWQVHRIFLLLLLLLLLAVVLILVVVVVVGSLYINRVDRSRACDRFCLLCRGYSCSCLFPSLSSLHLSLSSSP